MRPRRRHRQHPAACPRWVWHQKHRAAGEIRHTSIDTEAHWAKSGWHGWVYGWKLHLIVTAAGVWLPLRAAQTPANVADNMQAVELIIELPAAVRFVLGDGTLMTAGCVRAWRTRGTSW